jgi:molybdate transport system substrate-binding protein
VDIARSLIGMAVRSGAPKPDISTVDSFRQALLAARSVAYSASASGVYVETEMYKRMGIHDEMIGFQQVSELLPIEGIDFVGTIPEGVQQATIFCAGLATGAREPEAARALIRYLASAEAAPVLVRTGLEPIAGGRAGG